MAYLLPKPTKPQNWMATQVAYGVDCSDPEPKNWKPFGQAADQEAAKAGKSAAAPKPAPPA